MRGARRISLFLLITFSIILIHYFSDNLTSAWYDKSTAWLNLPFQIDNDQSPQYSSSSSPSSSSSSSKFPGSSLLPPIDNSEPTLLSPWAQESEYGAGTWIPRSPPYASFEEYKSLNQPKSGWFWSGCLLFNDSNIDEGEEKKNLQQERMKDLMNWVWQPSRGELVPFDPVELIVRLIQSPGGLVMLGDSITRQHHDALMTTLSKFEIPYEHMAPRLNYTARYVLRRGDPMTKVIQERAGVPDSRLLRPFLTSIQDHMVLPEEDIRRITNASESWVWPLKHHPHIEKLVERLHDVLMPVKGEEDTVIKDSILMFGTGPHWSRSRLPIPNTNYKDERAIMVDVYRKMMDILTARFSLLPQTTIIYRLTPAPHPQCHHHTKPYPNIATALIEDARIFELHTQGLDVHWRRIHAKWDWDLWNVYNKMWIEKIGELMKDSTARDDHEGEDGEDGAKWYFLDVAQMSLQRPDAHHEPGEDCLHYCLPTIYDDWTRFLYHRLFLLGEVSGPLDFEVEEPDVDIYEDEDI